MWAHLKAGSGSWHQADTELCLTTTVLLGKKAYLVEHYSESFNYVYGFHTDRKNSVSHPANKERACFMQQFLQENHLKHARAEVPAALSLPRALLWFSGYG